MFAIVRNELMRFLDGEDEEKDWKHVEERHDVDLLEVEARKAEWRE